MTISAVIIAKNEEKTIERCLQSLRFADEIVVVIDKASTDQTEKIARRYTTNVFARAWDGYGPQKNFGAERSSGDWLLFIDADEEVAPELAAEIKKVITDYQLLVTGYQFYWLRIITVFLGKPLRHLYGHNPRLFRKSAGRWTTRFVHEQVTRLSGSSSGLTGGSSPDHTISLNDDHSRVLTAPLLHYSHPTVRSYLAKMHRYTTLDARQMAKTNKHRSGRAVAPSITLPFRLAARQLIKMLFYKKGILDGWQGIVWCILSAYYEYEMGKKYLKFLISNT